MRTTDGTRWNPRSRGYRVRCKSVFKKWEKQGPGNLNRQKNQVGEGLRFTGQQSELGPFRDDEVLVDLRTRKGSVFSASSQVARPNLQTRSEGNLTDLILQYKILIRTSKGAMHTDKVFLSRNNRLDWVRSANEPNKKVTVAINSPIMVRYWKCHPYESLLGGGGGSNQRRPPIWQTGSGGSGGYIGDGKSMRLGRKRWRVSMCVQSVERCM